MAWLGVLLYALFKGLIAVGYVPPPAPPRLNLDRHGMPRDYATYVWVNYGKVVEDNSPERRAFLNRGPARKIEWTLPMPPWIDRGETIIPERR